MAWGETVRVAALVVMVVAAVVKSQAMERESVFEPLQSALVWTDGVDTTKALENNQKTQWWRLPFTSLPLSDFTLEWGGGFPLLSSVLHSSSMVDNTCVDSSEQVPVGPVGPVVLPSPLKLQPAHLVSRPPTPVDARPSTPHKLFFGKTDRQTSRQTERREKRKRERRRQRRAERRHQSNDTWDSESTKLGPTSGICFSSSSSLPNGLDGILPMIPLRGDPQGWSGIRPGILPEDFGHVDTQLVWTGHDTGNQGLPVSCLPDNGKAQTRRQTRKEGRQKTDKKADRQRGKGNKRTRDRQHNTKEERQNSTQFTVVLPFFQQQ